MCDCHHWPRPHLCRVSSSVECTRLYLPAIATTSGFNAGTDARLCYVLGASYPLFMRVLRIQMCILLQAIWSQNRFWDSRGSCVVMGKKGTTENAFQKDTKDTHRKHTRVSARYPVCLSSRMSVLFSHRNLVASLLHQDPKRRSAMLCADTPCHYGLRVTELEY
jgi:hypothetical protein